MSSSKKSGLGTPNTAPGKTSHDANADLRSLVQAPLERAGRAKMRSLIETAVARQNDVLIITEVNGSDEPVVYVNTAITHHSGYSPDEVLGRSPRMFQGPATSRATLDHIRAALDAREPVRAELLNYRKDGGQFWTEIDITPIFDSEGKATHMVSLQREITEQRHVRDAVQRKDLRFAQALEASANAIWEWNTRTDEVEYRDDMPERSWHGKNHGARRGNGLDVLLDLVHPDDRDTLRSTLRDTVAGDSHLRIEEYRLRRPDGSFASISDRQFIIRDPDGTAERLIGSMLDVSAKRELADRRKQSMRIELLGEMTAGISHNFNNLLTVILGAVDQLQNQSIDEDATRDAVRMIEKAALRGASLTEHLMSFSRSQTLVLQSVDVGRLIDQARPLWANLLAPGIRLRVHNDPALWPARSERSHLEAAILNLVINACDAMPGGGELTVVTENVDAGSDLIRRSTGDDDARHVMISITDTGVGMSPDQLASAFEPFFTTKPPGTGTGLGLSSAHGFMKQSGGFIRMKSTPGEGTSAHLFLKAADDHPEPETPTVQTVAPVDGGHRILVVDDDPLVRDYLQALLTSLKYSVVMAENGEEALRILATDDRIDLLFTDILMDGGMNGWELARSTLALFPDLPILFTSAYPDVVEPILHELPAARFLLRKPYRPRDLSLAILNTLAAASGPDPSS